MKSLTLSTTTALCTLLPFFGLAAPRTFQLTSNVAEAANVWAQDVSKVSQFLNVASTLSGIDFTDQATSALAMERDELTQKQTLDEVFGSNPFVQAANSTLVGQGTFQTVVSLLQDMAWNGVSRIGNVDAINHVRCTYVLPAIDAYFSAVAKETDGIQLLAVYPLACQ
jgi:hypothetical protein